MKNIKLISLMKRNILDKINLISNNVHFNERILFIEISTFLILFFIIFSSSILFLIME